MKFPPGPSSRWRGVSCVLSWLSVDGDLEKPSRQGSHQHHQSQALHASSPVCPMWLRTGKGSPFLSKRD